MKKIREDVLKVIQDFLNKKERFTSLDVYCLLGIRFNDNSYPIYEQVADAYRQGVMGQYLAEIAHIPLEHGGFANVWRYYYPTIDSKEFSLIVNGNDGSLKLDQYVLGHFPLLDIDFIIDVGVGKITFKPIKNGADTESLLTVNISEDIIIDAALLANAGLGSAQQLKVKVFSNRIEISE